MGKASRKKNQKKNLNTKKKIIFTPQELQMRQQMESGAYSQALETLAVIIKGKNLKPEFIFDGAVAYFKLGDLERAAEWVNNTLSFDAGHIGARILLAKICFAEGRRENGLAVLEFLIANGNKSLSIEALADIERLVQSELKGSTEDLRQKYPHLIKKYGVAEEVKPQMSSSVDILQALKAKISQAAHPVHENPEVSESEQQSLEETVPEENAASDVDQKVNEVLSKDIVLTEKIRMLGMFAGGYYVQRSLIEAEQCLQEALKLSPEDYLLRNMALLQQEMGNKDKALAFATRMKTMDFALLRQLR